MSRWFGGVSRIALIAVLAAGARPASAATVTISTTNTSQQTVNAGDSFTVTSTGKVSANADPAMKITSGAAASTITNSGTIESVASGAARGIRFVSPGTQFNVTIINNAGAFIQAPGDAIQTQQNISSSGVNTSTVLIDNAGTIRSTGLGANNGQGIDFNNITAGTASVTITNRATGLITAADADAIRPGNNAVIDNFGQIVSNIGTGANGNASGNDAVDFQGQTGTVNNMAGGLISSARHGITGDLGIVVNNSGTIIGNDGSGINIDSTTNASITTVVNHGTIIGTAKTADGDGIDVDRLLTLTNDGTIRAAGIAVAGELNEALAIGGGIINNLAGGSIISAQRAITVDDSNLGNAFAVVTINNAGLIEGDNGEAIKITSAFSNSLTNSGTILGSVVMGNGGGNIVTIQPGSKIVGLVDGGSGAADTLAYKKVGLTFAKEAALAAGQTVNIGGTLYKNFENFTGTIAQSFSSFATNGANTGVAAILDNGSTTQSANLALQTLIDQVATSTDVGAAMTQLSPTAFQAFSTIAINNALDTTQGLNQRMLNARGGALPFDVAGLDSLAMMMAGAENRTLPLSAQAAEAAGALGYAASPATARQHKALSALDKMAATGPIYKAPQRAVIADSPLGVFLYGHATFADQGATANSPKNSYTTLGVTFGVDYRFTPNFLAGAFGGYSRTDADLDQLGSTSKINTNLAGVYGSYFRDNWFVNGAFFYGWNSYHNDRIALGTSNVSAPHGNQYAVESMAGMDFRFGRWLVTPELGWQYTHVSVDGFTETGSPVSLTVLGDSAESFRTSLGGRARYDILMSWGLLVPEFRAAWQHEFLDSQRNLLANFVDPALPGSFATTALGNGRDFGLVGTGVSAQFGDRSQFAVNYDFKGGGHDFTAHQISGRWRHLF